MPKGRPVFLAECYEPSSDALARFFHGCGHNEPLDDGPHRPRKLRTPYRYGWHLQVTIVTQWRLVGHLRRLSEPAT
jgi:hypothetical protein